MLNMETIYKLKNKYLKGLIGKLEGVVVFQIVCLEVVDFVLFVYWGAAILDDAEAVMVTAFRGGYHSCCIVSVRDAACFWRFLALKSRVLCSRFGLGLLF